MRDSDIAKALRELRESVENARKRVQARRARNQRDSELAMHLAMLDRQSQALTEAINHFEGTRLAPEVLEKMLNVPVRSMEWSVRIETAFQRRGIETLRDVVRLSENELLLMPKFGRKSLNEVRQSLQRAGLRLGMKDV